MAGINLPETVLAAAVACGALVEGAGTAGSVGGSGQVGGSLLEVGSFEGHGTRVTGVGAVGSLEQHRGAAKALRAIVASRGREPLGVQSETEVDLGRLNAKGDVGVDSLERALDGSVMSRDVVTAVHEIVGHDLS